MGSDADSRDLSSLWQWTAAGHYGTNQGYQRYANESSIFPIHLNDLNLADPTFGEPGRILHGIEVYVNMLRHSRWVGPPGSPTALDTSFGWVLCGNVEAAAQE